jgi:EmrB/QacA subfamily drug resistance transporter
MASIVLAMLVSSMDTTIINTTMPVVAAELGHKELYAWTFAAYMIFSTVAAPIAGRLSDMFGRKHVFAGGIIFFMLGSLLCGFAGNMIQLVIFRAVQGLGAGVMMPFPNIIAGDLFSIEQRGKIQAFFSAMWGMSAVLAPVLGGLFVEQLSWRWIFYINAPVCILSFVLLLPYQEQYEPRRSRIDGWGAVLFSSGISLILLTTVVESYRLLYGVAGAALVFVFVRFESRHKSPMVPLELLKNPPVAWMIVNSFLACCALFGTSSYIPLFLQNEGYSITWSGIPFFGHSLGWMAVAVFAGKWVIRWGYRRLLIIGNAVLAVSGLMLALLSEGRGMVYTTLALIVQGVAFGLIVTVSIIGSQQLVHPKQKGVSTSLQMFSRNIGTAIGVTIMGTLLNRAASLYSGIQHLFLFGFLVSLLALASAFMLKGKVEEPQAVQV